MPQNEVVVENLKKTFERGDVVAVDSVSFGVEKGDLFAIIGPSGCGKTTTLRCIAGLEAPDSGKIFIDGKDAAGIPTHRRGVSLIFQNYALFPHRTVAENVAFGLRMKKLDDGTIRSEVRDALKLAGMEGFEDRHPRELSGGEQQRVALARSLVIKPKVLLLDEPLGSIDYMLQQRMMVELKQLHQRLGLTFVYVTHSQEQAMSLADMVMVMNKGIIEQIGTPEEIYSKPATVFVARFVGEINMLQGEFGSISRKTAIVRTDVGDFEAELGDVSPGATKVVYAVRPEKMCIGDEAKGCSNQLRAELGEQFYKGSDALYLARIPNGMQFKVTKQGDSIVDLGVGNQVLLGWNSEDVTILDKPSAVPGIDIDRILLGE